MRARAGEVCAAWSQVSAGFPNTEQRPHQAQTGPKRPVLPHVCLGHELIAGGVEGLRSGGSTFPWLAGCARGVRSSRMTIWLININHLSGLTVP